MKKLVLLLILSFANLFLLSSEIIKDSAVCLLIRGKILNSGDNHLGLCKIELINHHGVVDSVILKHGSKSFKFTLIRNSQYTIRIFKKGYVPKRISIDTSILSDLDKVYDFAFGVELMTTLEGDRLNKDALNLPVAIISFNERLKIFHYNKGYTANIKREIHKKCERKIVATAD